MDLLSEEHINRCRNHSIVPCIGPIAYEERSSPLDVVDHAAEEMYTPPS